MTVNEAKKEIPVKEGRYKLPTNGSEGYLLGTKCRQCGDYHYPLRHVCLNCFSEDVEEVALSNKGKLWTYSVARHTYPHVYLKPPFIIAKVLLPENVFVNTILTDIEYKDAEVGMDVRIYFFPIKEDEEQKIIAFAFKPISA